MFERKEFLIWGAEDNQCLGIVLEQVGLMVAVMTNHFSIFPSDPLQNPMKKAEQPLLLPPLPVKQQSLMN